jgi:hypothetical protein
MIDTLVPALKIEVEARTFREVMKRASHFGDVGQHFKSESPERPALVLRTMRAIRP